MLAATSQRAGVAVRLAFAAFALTTIGCGKDNSSDATSQAAAAPSAGQIGDATLEEPGQPVDVEAGSDISAGTSTMGAAPGGTRDGRSACPDKDLVPSSSNIERLNKSIFCLVNGERSNRRIPKLRRNSKLDQAASRHAKDMAGKDYFAHQSKTGTTPAGRVRKTGYLTSDSWSVGENIAWGTGDYGTPRAIVAAWMNSPAHRRNIVDHRFKEIGLGATADLPNKQFETGATYVNDFGTLR